ncbi:MAG: molybdate ABC transporter permease subunit [Actinobacteria bacterium]|nr:molybdate ABC transporter permease subunit [Actinomycetota bacterium]
MTIKFSGLTKTLAAIAGFIVIAPMLALLMKVSWLNYFSNLGDLRAVWLSMWTSFLAVVIALALGTPLAWVLAKSKSRFLHIIRPLILAPIVLPPTVAGMALIALLGRNGLLGHFIYKSTSFSIPFTPLAVIIALIFVGLPFVVLICESNFRQLPKDVEDAALIDRAMPTHLFRLIALPQSRSAIATAGILAWARAIGEFGATLMFAGSLPGSTQTWTMLIYQELDIDQSAAYSLSALMLVLSIFVVFIARKPLRNSLR